MEMNQYLEVFIEESKEHLQTCNDKLLELEKNPQDLLIVNEIFRSAHTLKGMSATMGYEDLANLTHNMENVLDGIRNEKIVVSTEILDVLFQSTEDLEAMVISIAEGGDGKRNVEEVVSKLSAIEKGEVIVNSMPTKNKSSLSEHPKTSYDQFEQTVIQQSEDQGFDCFEITVQLREDCLLKAARVFMVFEILEKNGEVIKSTPSVDQLEEENFDHQFTVTLITKQNKNDLQGMIKKVSEVDKVDIINVTSQSLSIEDSELVEKHVVESTTTSNEKESSATKAKVENKSETTKTPVASKTIRVNIERLDVLMNLFEELVIDRGRLESISKDLNHSELNETVERMTRISGDLQTIILTMRMVPVETVFNRFPRMVRQLARDLNKKINLEIIGAETELDRTVIDEIGDPLVHLIRNALDHGVETPEVRLANGKSEEGTVKLQAYHSGNHVFIELSDDGAGINRDRVLQKAISKGIISKEEGASLSDQQVFELIMSSGFSTADNISDISGRGVGMDVVKTTIESLGGSISIDSIEGEGSTFSIQLPLTLSIISVMLVELQKEKYAIPLSSIIETAIIKKSDILNAHNQKVIDFRGKVVPLVFLEEVFEVPGEKVDQEFLSIIIVRKGDKMAGLVVDSFIGQQEVVLKSLGNYLNDIFAISGATILGDGQVALILDCNALIK
ncbi:chemotaxis protein CheA [Bacillus coahuilensis p1.1.43]|uniref:Chemotaxis protein CheA n=1 Tax=Bacillus coahuilensis p1.1.43 TaxID=1150625 RepID=A0A147K9L0_9BACI|nr:chemotaxis protein CheA [Bacillus coahuilensis]KUP07127.1 chemotaxis protein CheA [Bacillus coahuilensis p1.1.43]